MKKIHINVDDIGTTLKISMGNLDKKTLVGGTESFDTLNDLLKSADTAITNTIKSATTYFNTTNVYIDSVTSYKTKTPNIRTLLSARKTLNNQIKNGSKFYKIADIKAPVILGLQATLPEIVGILKNNTHFVKGIEDTMLNFSDALDDIINSGKKGIIVDTDNSNAIFKQTKAINKELSVVTSTKILTDRKPINSLVNNFKELMQVTENTLVLGETYNMEVLEKLHDINTILVGKLDIVHKALEVGDTTIDKSVLKELVEYINNVARFLTAVAFLFYLYYQLTNMVTVIIKITDASNTDNSIIDNFMVNIKRGTKNMRSFLTDLTA